jgi:hypothetical protein
MISSVQPAQPHEENPQLLRAIGRKKAAGFTLEQRRYAFTNTFTEEESKALYERYHIPGQYGCCGALEPGHQDTFVNYDNDGRAPLLFISGGEDPTSCLRASRAPTPSITSPRRDRGQGVPRLRPLPTRPEGLGADRGRRPGLGRGARMVTTAAPDPVPSPSRVTQAA